MTNRPIDPAKMFDARDNALFNNDKAFHVETATAVADLLSSGPDREMPMRCVGALYTAVYAIAVNFPSGDGAKDMIGRLVRLAFEAGRRTRAEAGPPPPPTTTDPSRN